LKHAGSPLNQGDNIKLAFSHSSQQLAVVFAENREPADGVRLRLCNGDCWKSYRLWGVKQEQDLFLRFLAKKALDSLEKVAIVPISVVLCDVLNVFVSFSWTNLEHSSSSRGERLDRD